MAILDAQDIWRGLGELAACARGSMPMAVWTEGDPRPVDLPELVSASSTYRHARDCICRDRRAGFPRSAGSTSASALTVSRMTAVQRPLNQARDRSGSPYHFPPRNEDIGLAFRRKILVVSESGSPSPSMPARPKHQLDALSLVE